MMGLMVNSKSYLSDYFQKSNNINDEKQLNVENRTTSELFLSLSLSHSLFLSLSLVSKGFVRKIPTFSLIKHLNNFLSFYDISLFPSRLQI